MGARGELLSKVSLVIVFLQNLVGMLDKIGEMVYNIYDKMKERRSHYGRTEKRRAF